MSAEALDFSFDLAGIDRSALLQEAAERVNTLHSHFGGGPAHGGGGDNRLHSLLGDEASIAKFPDIHRLTTDTFLEARRPAPISLEQLTRDFRYYFLRIPIGLAPAHNWAFNRLEVRIDFSESSPEPHKLPRSYQLLPDSRFETIANAELGMEVQLNERLEFEAKAAVAPMLTVGGAATVAPSFNAVLGPFKYNIKRARIQNNGTGLEWVFWRIDGAEFFQEDRPELIIVLQVPEAADRLRAKTILQAYRKYSFGTAGLMDIAKQLPARIRNFINSGMPCRDEKEWDLTPRM